MECEKAFMKAKKVLSSASVLAHMTHKCHSDLQLMPQPMRCMGAVISDAFPDGSEHLTAYASRMLTANEKN